MVGPTDKTGECRTIHPAEGRKLPIIVGYDPRDIYNIDKNIS
jgi:hypothetical protein